MLKRLLSIGLAIGLTFSLAACGNKSAGTNTGTNDSKAVELQIVGAGLSDEAYAAAKDAQTDNNNKYAIAVTDEVKKKYPAAKIYDWGWAEQLDQKQRASILSGNSSDLVHGEIFMPSYASEDILEPLPQDIVDMVNPNFILKNKQGQPVAVSRWGNIFMLFYNKDLLQQAGVDPNISIKTWDDWKKVSDQITSKGNGKIFGGGVPSHPHAGGALRAVPFIRQLGADFGGGSAATINTPEMIKALTFIREMDKNFPKGIGNNPDEGPLYSMFEKDKALAFVVNGTWQESGCVNAGMKNYSAVSLPMAEGGKVSNCLVGFDYYGVPKASKHKDEAFEVIRMMLNKDLQKLMDNIPANKEILADPNYAKEFPSKAAAAKELLNGSFSGLVVFDKNNSQIWDVINNKVIARVTMTNDPIDKIVAEGQAEVEKLLK